MGELQVSASSSAEMDRILALQPDLVFGLSEMHADIAAAFIRAGIGCMELLP